MWKSCARVWPRSRRCAEFPSWVSCRILRSTLTTRTRSRRAYLPARRAASSTSPSCAFRICRTSPTSTRFRACPAWACATFPRRPIWADPTWWCSPARRPRSTTRAGLRLAASEPVYARFRARACRCSAYAEATSFWGTSFPTRTAGKALAPRAGSGSSLQVRCSRRKSASPSRSCASRAPKARSRRGTA